MKTKSIFKISLVFLSAVLICLPINNYVFAFSNPQAQTNAATNLQNNSATLNGNLIDLGGYGSSNVWFQWGSDTNYGNTTSSVFQNYIGAFSQQINNLSYNQTYHYRAVAQNSYGISYGQDMQFTLGQANNIANYLVQTNAPTYVQNNSATLNGALSNNNSLYSYNSTGAFVWFQWGTDTNYGSSSFQQSLSYSGAFFQSIANLTPNTVYHYRAVAQINGQTIYGQDITFNSNGSVGNGNNIYSPTITITTGGTGASLVSVTKNVRNLSSGNLTWAISANASPSDVLQFSVSAQNLGSQTIHSILVKDLFPANLIYYNNLTVDGNSSGGDITQGINIGDILPGQTRIIIYQAQIESAGNFLGGQNTITSSVSATSSDGGNTSATSTIYVTKLSLISAATVVSTGLTNNFIFDSFFIPLLLLIIGIWLWKSDLARWFINQFKPKNKK